MSEPALNASELLAWLETTAAGWRNLLTTHPELLHAPCDITGVHTVAELLQHIVAVELRYAERLAGLPATEYAAVPFDSLDSLYVTHDRALAIYRELLASGTDWSQPIEYTTRAIGMSRSARRTILFHAIFHSIRHYAQLATLARQHGVKPKWPMDYIFMDIAPV